MTGNFGWLVAAVFLLQVACTKCEYEELAASRGPGGVSARVVWGVCGTARAIDVVVEGEWGQQKVFFAQFPRDAVADPNLLPTYVHLRWSQDGELLIEFADWLRPELLGEPLEGLSVHVQPLPDSPLPRRRGQP